MVIIVWVTPPKTPPVTPSNVMIAQFIPCVAGALGSPKQVEQYKSGKKAVIGYLVGQVMKASKGRANPGLANKLLKQQLD